MKAQPNEVYWGKHPPLPRIIKKAIKEENKKLELLYDKLDVLKF